MIKIFIYTLVITTLSFSLKNRIIVDECKDCIVWKPNSKLKWGDFQGSIDEKSEYKATTFVQIGLSSHESENFLEIDVPCYFIKNMSWTKEKTANLLKHEQLHFDIAEFISRKIRKEFADYKSIDIKNTYLDLKGIYKKYYHNKLDSLNSKYDFETNHGINEVEQKNWEVKIMLELNKLEKYSSTKISIKLSKH